MSQKLLPGVLLLILAANANAAEAPKVKLGGYIGTTAAYFNHDDKRFESTNPATPSKGNYVEKQFLVNNTKINVDFEAKYNSDVKYGGRISLNADTSKSQEGESTPGYRTMAYIQNNKLGRVEAGNTIGGHVSLARDVHYLNIGFYGAEGAINSYLPRKSVHVANITNNLSTNGLGLPQQRALLNGITGGVVPDTRGTEFLYYSTLPSHYAKSFYHQAPKVNLYTKLAEEVKVAFTYIPDLDSSGTVANVAYKTNGARDTADGRNAYPATFRDIVGGGISYDKKLDKDWSLLSALVGEIGRAKHQGLHDLRAYDASMKVGYKNFKLSGSYGTWGNTGTYKVRTAGSKQGAWYWTSGFSHEIDKFAYSLTYSNTRRAGGLESLGKKITSFSTSTISLAGMEPYLSDKSYNKYRNMMVDVDYKLATGILPFAAVSRFEFKESTGAKDKGYFSVVGTRMLF
jgi:hypothetical protein